MFLLYETPAGLALFRHLNPKKTETAEEIQKSFATKEKTLKTLQLVSFQKFEDTAAARVTAERLAGGKMSKDLASFLRKNVPGKETLFVCDPKLGRTIKKKLDLDTVANELAVELARGVRANIAGLLDGIDSAALKKMHLGLGHTYSQAKIKFSVDRIDTMVVQAVSLLDDIDKEINNYAMRLREWYGWHFPELGKAVADNTEYARAVKRIGFRQNIATADLAGILQPETIACALAASKMSMGTEINTDDLEIITGIADQLLEIAEYRVELYDYLQNRMRVLSPNLSALVGELLGARLVAHTGSVMDLAKCPSSTVQIIGAEKALFKALKARQSTPKYGLLFGSTLVGKASHEAKGAVARMLAAKISLTARVDAIKQSPDSSFGEGLLLKLEKAIGDLETKCSKKKTQGNKKGTFVAENNKRRLPADNRPRKREK
ncbi:MAG: U3 snoRNP protein Nop5/Nop58 [Amphiamblys sp. WSBS2006]|nr:MAG: U3 snoRNP protein Nop5/Nop58 [Amphiamblys sp. WSBS2006]